MPIATFRTAQIYEQSTEQTGHVWREGSSLAVRERPSAGRAKVWSLHHIPSGMALDSIVPVWLKTKADKLWLCEMIDTHMPDDVALMTLVPFGGGAEAMGADLREACLSVRRYAMTLERA